ncbi:MAG: Clp protease ClpS [Flavobacteriaceae bacterium]|nr:Clp protease ClpS [Flavobacteriaceae bacterium]|tara:strand:+ start:4757 stop:5071 length:315 start_codon:yes stop_codon:yes gene_type:complete
MVIYSLHEGLKFKSEPKVNPDDDQQLTVKTDRKHELILFNDEVNTFDYVTKTLMVVCDHTFIQAQQCTYIVHFSGKCVVKTGPISDLEPRCIKLLDAGLSAEIV